MDKICTCISKVKAATSHENLLFFIFCYEDNTYFIDNIYFLFKFYVPPPKSLPQ
ncbi:hypothetical protein T492DRAFT_1061151 [Pavlovales sp. CCMP2436]|nr:hypothetical protein T492DRAFT_1061151 [Pavlovales sp. CCMP2436]